MLLDSLLVTYCNFIFNFTEGLGLFVVIRNIPYIHGQITGSRHARNVYATHTDLRLNWFSVVSAGEIVNVPDRLARKCQLLRMPHWNVNIVTKENVTDTADSGKKET